MKPAAFTYHAPATIDAALQVLDEFGDTGKVLAGGQSLVPILNMRLAAPAHLVDINGIAGLDAIRSTPDGVYVGATVRHAALGRDVAAERVQPLLGRATRLVAHPAIRNRGTTCGSLAHADPAGELTAVLALTDGTVRISSRGRPPHDIAAAAFFLGPLESCLQPGELVLGAHFPAFAAGTGSAFTEVARRHGDYALCGVAAAVTVDAAGTVSAARAAYICVAATPLLLDLTDAVSGAAPATADWAAAGRLARDRVTPEADIHATATYRRQLVGVLTERALREAAGRAREPAPAVGASA